MRQVHAVMTFDIDAKRKTRLISPCDATTSPERITAHAACGTGHESMVDRSCGSDESGKAGRAYEFSHAESQVKALARIQTRVAHGLVTHIKISISEIVGATQALGDIVAS